MSDDAAGRAREGETVDALRERLSGVGLWRARRRAEWVAVGDLARLAAPLVGELDLPRIGLVDVTEVEERGRWGRRRARVATRYAEGAVIRLGGGLAWNRTGGGERCALATALALHPDGRLFEGHVWLVAPQLFATVHGVRDPIPLDRWAEGVSGLALQRQWRWMQRSGFNPFVLRVETLPLRPWSAEREPAVGGPEAFAAMYEVASAAAAHLAAEHARLDERGVEAALLEAPAEARRRHWLAALAEIDALAPGLAELPVTDPESPVRGGR